MKQREMQVQMMGWAALAAAVLAACGSTGESAPEGDGALQVGDLKAALTLEAATDVCAVDPRVTLGLTSLDVCVGAELFFRGTFGGNGRSCASCHPAANNYTIDAPFISTLPDTDPLFVAEQGVGLDDLERPDLMRQFGLILENVDGLEAPTQKFVMRSVPHCFSMGTSVTAQAVPTDGTTRPPNERTGWSGDGAPNAGELRDFQTGAIIQHYPKSLARNAGQDFVLATAAELDAIRDFTATIGRLNELDLSAVTLTDSGASSGRATFMSAPARCNGCHANAGANVAAGFNRNFDTGVERVRLPELDAQNIPFDGGFGGGGLAAFNFDANGDGVLDSFGNGGFNTPPLIEAADTGPFFHTNAFETIEDAIGFYTSDAFNQSPSGAIAPISLTPTEIGNMGRFLRVLNVAFNAQLAERRIEAALAVIDGPGSSSAAVETGLLELALAEVDDAIDLLAPLPTLNSASRGLLMAARAQLENAAQAAAPQQRRALALAALDKVTDANSRLGSGMGFTMGQGTLMF